jgi:hypothetical protein
VKIDLHMHTCASGDALHTLKQMALRAKALKLDGIGVCEHNKINSGNVDVPGLLILRGMECSAKEGHISVFGVGSNFDFEKGMPAAEIAKRAKKAGGISIVTHAFSIRKRKSSMGSHCFHVGATAIERFNGSDFVHNFIASRRVPIGTGGSDAHSWYEVGNAYTVLNCKPREDDVLDAIKAGKMRAVMAQNVMAIARRKWERFLAKGF